MPEQLTQAQRALRDGLRDFIDADLRVLERDYREAAGEEGRRRVLAAVRQRSRALGFFGRTQPVELGGTAATAVDRVLLREALSASGLQVAAEVLGPGPGVLAAAGDDLRASHLLPLLRGDKRAAFGFTEPEDASRPTWAQRRGDTLLVTGAKSYVTGGDNADFIAVLVNVEESPDNPRGTAMVIVDRDAPGLTVERRFDSLDGSHHVSLRLDAVPVPVSRIVGAIGEGLPRALGAIGEERLLVAADAVGLCLAAIAQVRSHLLAARRGGALAQREGVRLRYADLRIDTAAARSLLYRTARLVDGGGNRVNETAAVKVFCTETAGRVVDLALQLTGGRGLENSHPMAGLYRRARALRFVEGASDLLRLQLARGDLEFELGAL
jgi:acyl-CoA dehydrogenase